MKNKLIACVLLACCLSLYPQKYGWESDVAPVPADGFYKIMLSPAICGKMQPDLRDIRLYDSTGTELPYLLSVQQRVSSLESFVPFPELQKTSTPRKQQIVFHNASKLTLQHIVLKVQNTELLKRYSLEGSNDRKEWYGIKDRCYLDPQLNVDTTFHYQWITIPKSNYEFFRLQIDIVRSTSINILEAGYYNLEYLTAQYSSIPVKKMEVRDSSKTKETWLIVKLDQHYYCDKIRFTVDSPAMFFRYAHILKRTVKKGHTSYYPVTDFVLSSDRNPQADLDHYYTDELIVVIGNKDDQPLKISSCELYMINTALVASLKKEIGYSLQFGDSKAPAAPEYDLEHFRNKIPDLLATISAGSMHTLSGSSRSKRDAMFNDILLWAVILTVGSVLVIMTIRMMKDDKGNTDKE